MEFNLTNKQVEALYDAIVTIQDAQFPVTIAFKLLKNKQTLQPIYEAIEQCRYEVIKKYGEITDNNYVIPAKFAEYYQAEMKQLYSETNEDIKLDKVQLPVDSNCSIALLEALSPILDMDD